MSDRLARWQQWLFFGGVAFAIVPFAVLPLNKFGFPSGIGDPVFAACSTICFTLWHWPFVLTKTHSTLLRQPSTRLLVSMGLGFSTYIGVGILAWACVLGLAMLGVRF